MSNPYFSEKKKIKLLDVNYKPANFLEFLENFYHKQILNAFNLEGNEDIGEAYKVLTLIKKKMKSFCKNLNEEQADQLKEKNNVLKLMEISISTREEGWDPSLLNTKELIDLLTATYKDEANLEIIRNYTGEKFPATFYYYGYNNLQAVFLDIHFTRFNGYEKPLEMAHYYRMRYMTAYFCKSVALSPKNPDRGADQEKADELSVLVVPHNEYELCPKVLLKNYDEALKFTEKLFKYCVEIKNERWKQINKNGSPTREEKIDFVLRLGRMNFKKGFIYSTIAKMNDKLSTKEKLYRSSLQFYLEDRQECLVCDCEEEKRPRFVRLEIFKLITRWNDLILNFTVSIWRNFLISSKKL